MFLFSSVTVEIAEMELKVCAGWSDPVSIGEGHSENTFAPFKSFCLHEPTPTKKIGNTY